MNETSAPIERMRLRVPLLRLRKAAHTECTVLARFPLSKCVNVRFDGTLTATVREDQLEPIPPAEEEAKAGVEISEERIAEVGMQAAIAEGIDQLQKADKAEAA